MPGLIFKAFADEGDGLLEFVYIPVDLFATCTEIQSNPRMRPPRRRPSLHIGRSRPSIPWPLMRCKSSPPCVRRRSAWIARGSLRAVERKQLTEGLILKDPTRLDFLLALLQKLGALSIERGRLQTAADGSQAWLRLGSWPQITALFQAWLDSAASDWNDLRHVPGLKRRRQLAQ